MNIFVTLYPNLLEITYFSKPEFKKPIMLVAWPGMGLIAKISADYLRRRLNAKLFAEIVYYHNVLIYNNSIGELTPINHRFYYVPDKDLIILVGDTQPSIPEETMRLAELILKAAEDFKVKRIYSIAAFPGENEGEPKVYGICNQENLKPILQSYNVGLLHEEGAVNGLNGIIIGVAKKHGIEGICLMGDIKYANVPQHLAAKAILMKLSSFINIDLDTSLLDKRAKRIDASIKKRLELYVEDVEMNPLKDKKLDYIS
ncbi:PAC2 family protein [Candidatus Bathyarchaeota archaeon]|nr:PAC2 family protein [Candidatus Bathyarchaeota archaeon]